MADNKAAEVPVAAPAVVAPAEAAPAAAAPAAQPSLLAGADAGKHAHADAKPEAKVDAPKPDAAAAEVKPDAKPDAVIPAKDGAETAAKPEVKPDAAAAEAAKAEDGKAKPEAAKEGEKPADAKPEAKPEKDSAEKPAEKPAEALAEKPPVPPQYDAFKLPDNIKADEPRLAEFTSILGKTELAGKVDHKLMQNFGQELIDFHTKEMLRTAQEVTQHQIDVWSRMKEGWINKLKSDPDLGGNRIETSLGNAKYAFENFLGLNKDQQGELLAVMDNAGLSDHPVMVRALHNLYERLAEPMPVNPNLPGNADPKGKGAGERGWYSTVDGVKLA